MIVQNGTQLELNEDLCFSSIDAIRNREVDLIIDSNTLLDEIDVDKFDHLSSYFIDYLDAYGYINNAGFVIPAGTVVTLNNINDKLECDLTFGKHNEIIVGGAHVKWFVDGHKHGLDEIEVSMVV